MKNFKDFDELVELLESLNFSYDVQWKEKTIFKQVGYFKDEQYKIECYNFIDNNWFFKFYKFDNEIEDFVTSINPKEKTLSFTESSNILGTIRRTILDFIKSEEPNSVSFIAIDNSKGRKGLYDLFSNEIINKYNKYKNISYLQDNYKLYIIFKDKKDIIKIRKAIYDEYKILF